jgi:hypothetical protein
MALLSELLVTFIETLGDVLPIAGILIGFQFLVLRERIPNMKRVLLGFFYVLCGLALFLVGLEKALFPLGKVMAAQLTHPDFLLDHAGDILEWNDYYWVYLFAAAIGLSTTIAEPSLIAVALKANKVSGGAINPWGLRIAVAVGAAIGISLGAFRIITGTPLHLYIVAGYVIVIVQTIFAPRMIVALAYDSGGVTTSTVTVPLVTALGLGLASTVPGRSPLLDGFGMIAFTCLFPIMTVMAYAQITEWRARRDARARKEGD